MASAKQSSSSTEERQLLAKAWFDRYINLEDLFRCAICHCAISVKHPIHCPHCSKLFCRQCIDQWLNRRDGRERRSMDSIVKRCPCCQSQVEANSFVCCRVYRDVIDLTQQLRDNVEELIQVIRRPLRMCDKHEKELLLFCQACGCCICVKCLFSEPHSVHNSKVLDLDSARQKFKEMIAKENQFLTARLKALQSISFQIATNESDITDANDHIVNQLHWAAERLIDKLRDEMSERFGQNTEPVKDTKQQHKEVENVMQKAIELASEDTSPEVVTEMFKMLDVIKNIRKKPLPVPQLPETSFIDRITPPLVVFDFLLYNFSETVYLNRSMLSDVKSIEGFTMQLKGHQEYDDSGNEVIRLSLVVVDGYDAHDVKVFCYPTKRMSQCEPLVRLMDIKRFENNTVLEFSGFQAMEGFLEERTDELHLKMKMQLWATYYDKCVHKDWYIAKLLG
ncbi:E3 ubiquitin-protein ligase TRIM37-like [Sabethes cyaneus]|uniref:E3 ubiquitin-protein ligase TRIM37-like n=1 Tax=Sabethes cyaneus TaxID=53552 RepID=UPI00237E2B29|nr:E3 ubiquitin-protein ligase TRIM37-like [Sabethes cyaneus]